MTEKKVVLVLGQRGSGKSFLAKHLIADHKRVIIYDTLGEYDGEGISCENIEEFKEYLLSVYQGSFRIVYQPVKPEIDFDIICDLVYECGDLSFLVEEIDTFCNSQGLPDNFANVIQRGRHKNITFIGVSQRPFGIPRIITSQAKTIYTFLHREPKDLDYLKQYIGDEAEKIKDLQQYQYLKWDNGSSSIGKV